MKAFLTLSTAFVLIFSSLEPALGQDSSPAGILAELDQLMAQKKANAAKLTAGAPQLKLDIPRVKTLTTVDIPRLEKQKQAVEQYETDFVVPVCNVTVPKEQYDAAVQRCKLAQTELKKRNDAYDLARAPVNAELAKIQARLLAYQKLIDAQNDVERKMRAARGRLELAYREECVRLRCNGSAEETSQCFQECWDGAKAQAASALQRHGISINPNL